MVHVDAERVVEGRLPELIEHSQADNARDPLCQVQLDQRRSQLRN